MHHRSFTVTFFMLLLVVGELCSQSYQFRPHKFGINLFSGGIDTPRYQFVDIDADGDQDLFIFDRDELLWFYRNKGGQFLLEPFQTFGLTIGSWFRFVDIDADGDLDCFTNGEFSEVSLFTNIGTSTSPNFQRTTTAVIDTNGIELFSERFSIPTFADIDNDGDFDFFSGSQSGTITHYQNVGATNSPVFAFVTNVFNGIQIIGSGGKKLKPKHGASSLEFFDADSNGTLDIFLGDYFNPSMYVLQNIGSATTPNFILTDSTYPKGNVINTSGFNIPQHVDINGDGKVDLVSGCVFPTEGIDNFWYFKNTGTNSVPQYVLESKNMIPMIDVGSRSSVTAADLDGDGDVDLCIASANGEIRIYENKGTVKFPIYSPFPSYSKKLNLFYCTVASGDLDGNGSIDLLVGDFGGGIRFLKNNSDPTQFQFDQQPFQLDTVKLGNSSAPCIGDVDNDGIIDILVGNSAGTLSFYKNIGSNSLPSYILISNLFNGIDVGNESAPFLFDVNNNGKNDLLIGNSTGKIFHYEYNPISHLYDSVNSLFHGIDFRVNVFPYCVDIDGDDDIDLLIGNGKGGVYFYENTTINEIQSTKTTFPLFLNLFSNYPNPFNPYTTISFSLDVPSFVKVSIFNILGKEIETIMQSTLRNGIHLLSWNGSAFPSGIYYYRISAYSNDDRHTVRTRSMMLIK